MNASPSSLAAAILSEALPFMQRYDGKTIVIKYGGHAMGDLETARSFAADVIQLRLCGVRPIVVHGGGPQIEALLKRLNIATRFVDGLRVTDRETMEIVEMVLCGSINKGIVDRINRLGGRAVGLSGKDDRLVTARRYSRSDGSDRDDDLGLVGAPHRIEPRILSVLADDGVIPVIASVAGSEEGEAYNVNADAMAGALAGALGATRLLMLTDTPGVRDAEGEMIASLGRDEALSLIETGIIQGGMIPKVETCVAAVRAGVGSSVILDGRVPHVTLLELFTEYGAGTLIKP